MPSGGWMPEIDVFAQWQLEQQQPYGMGRLEEQHPMGMVPDSPPVSMIGMKRGRLSDLDEALFAKRHRSSIECDDMVPSAPSQPHNHMSGPYAEKEHHMQAVENSQTTTPMIEAERQYNNGYINYFTPAAATVQNVDQEMETVDHAGQSQHQMQTASPNTCERYVTDGCYSPRQVQSYCRPSYGRNGDACLLFPYHSDFY